MYLYPTLIENLIRSSYIHQQLFHVKSAIANIIYINHLFHIHGAVAVKHVRRATPNMVRFLVR